ncbi:MAG: hypothetical protein JXQ90_13440 [Cyclobacteriaceae bacterium]
MIRTMIFGWMALSAFASVGQTLEAVLDKHFEVHQQDLWDQLRTVTGTGYWHHRTKGDHNVEYYIMPGKFLMQNRKEQFIEASAGFQGWEMAKWTGKKVVDLDVKQEALLQIVFYFGSPLKHIEIVEFKGKVSVDHIECNWLQEVKGSIVRDYFIDATSHLLYRINIKTADFELSRTVKEYKNFSGLQLPTVVTMKTNEVEAEYSFYDITIGDRIDPSIYKKPNQ